MSKKTDLIKVLQGYMTIYENAQAGVKQYREDSQYSEEGKKAWIESIMNRLATETLVYHDKAIKIIDDGLNALEAKWKKNSIGRATDGGYQAGLANVIKMLEIGAIRDADDIKNIIDTYSEDFNAMAAIRRILVDCENGVLRDCISLIPEDYREKNRELLGRLKAGISKYINVNRNSAILDTTMFLYGLTGVVVGLEGQVQFLQDRLDDDLELLH